MFDPGKLAILFAALALSCCKSDHSAPGHVAPQQVTTPEKTAHGPVDAIPSAHAPVGQPEAASGGGSADSPNAAPWPKDLPHLKPVIDKPFPEGATEAQVCEAIDNTAEKDLWVRFGHLVPMYVFGSMFALEAPGQTPAQIREFVRANHYGYDSRTQFCGQSKALVYVRSLGENHDNGGRIEGRDALAEQFQSDSKFKVLESYAIPTDRERLSDYCRADAELCEALVKLDYMNRGKGLCSFAISRAGTDASDDKHLQTCLSLPAKSKACAYVSPNNERERITCRCLIRGVLGLKQLDDCPEF